MANFSSVLSPREACCTICAASWSWGRPFPEKIGRHFPDTDPQYKGISSILLLQKVGALLKEKGYQIVNIDATIIAQKPKLLPHIDQMIKNVADALELSEDQVNIKATTEEGLGFTGTLQGISSQAICCIQTAQN